MHAIPGALWKNVDHFAHEYGIWVRCWKAEGGSLTLTRTHDHWIRKLVGAAQILANICVMLFNWRSFLYFSPIFVENLVLSPFSLTPSFCFQYQHFSPFFHFFSLRRFTFDFLFSDRYNSWKYVHCVLQVQFHSVQTIVPFYRNEFEQKRKYGFG